MDGQQDAPLASEPPTAADIAAKIVESVPKNAESQNVTKEYDATALNGHEEKVTGNIEVPPKKDDVEMEDLTPKVTKTEAIVPIAGADAPKYVSMQLNKEQRAMFQAGMPIQAVHNAAVVPTTLE